MDNNELYHHGVKGMKWGVRKDYVKAKGHAVKKKATKLYADIKKKVKARREAEKARKHEEDIMKKPVKKLTSAELQERAKILAARKSVLELEKSCKNLNNDTLDAGKAFMKKFANDAVGAAVIGAGKNVLQDYFTKIGKDKLGLNVKDVKDSLPEVKTWDDLIKKRQYDDETAKRKKAAADAKKEAEANATTASTKDASSDKNTQTTSNNTGKTKDTKSQKDTTASNSDDNDSTNSSTKKSEDKTERYEPTADDIIDPPPKSSSSTKSSSSNKTTIDGYGEWVDDSTTVSNLPAVVTSRGSAYIAGLLEDK